MSKGISNFQIEQAFKNIWNKDINGNFAGVFPLNSVSKFIDHKMMISEKKGKNPFIVANTDNSNKEGTH